MAQYTPADYADPSMLQGMPPLDAFQQQQIYAIMTGQSPQAFQERNLAEEWEQKMIAAHENTQLQNTATQTMESIGETVQSRLITEAAANDIKTYVLIAGVSGTLAEFQDGTVSMTVVPADFSKDLTDSKGLITLEACVIQSKNTLPTDVGVSFNGELEKNVDFIPSMARGPNAKPSHYELFPEHTSMNMKTMLYQRPEASQIDAPMLQHWFGQTPETLQKTILMEKPNEPVMIVTADSPIIEMIYHNLDKVGPHLRNSKATGWTDEVTGRVIPAAIIPAPLGNMCKTDIIAHLKSLPTSSPSRTTFTFTRSDGCDWNDLNGLVASGLHGDVEGRDMLERIHHIRLAIRVKAAVYKPDQ